MSENIKNIPDNTESDFYIFEKNDDNSTRNEDTEIDNSGKLNYLYDLSVSKHKEKSEQNETIGGTNDSSYNSSFDPFSDLSDNSSFDPSTYIFEEEEDKDDTISLSNIEYDNIKNVSHDKNSLTLTYIENTLQKYTFDISLSKFILYAYNLLKNSDTIQEKKTNQK